MNRAHFNGLPSLRLKNYFLFFAAAGTFSIRPLFGLVNTEFSKRILNQENNEMKNTFPQLRRATLGLAALLAVSGLVQAQSYAFSVVAKNLHRPTGIAIRGDDTILFTEVPTPGVNGARGGSNAVSSLNLDSGKITTLHMGEPEPVNLALGQGRSFYWTCKSAGVILEQANDGTTSVFLGGLKKPSGVAVDRDGTVFFTQIPTPGVNGANGGSNSVSMSDGTTTAVLHIGEPEPTDITVARNGDLYWTCKTAGVILEQTAAGVTTVFAKQLNKPAGIIVDRQNRHLYFTEVPTPGVSGANGGSNKIWEIDLKTGAKTLVHAGDPEPTDITVARNGNLYWTCSSAGVIVEAKRKGERKEDGDNDRD